MSSKRYTEDFKVEAVKQVTERGHSVSDVASRLGISMHSLYAWRKQYANASAAHPAAIDQASELRGVMGFAPPNVVVLAANLAMLVGVGVWLEALRRVGSIKRIKPIRADR